MSEWPLAKLSELGEVNRGRSRHRPRDAAHLYGGNFPFVQTGDIKASNGRVTRYLQTYNDAGLAQSRLWPIGTMCITIAANIAETGILTFPACFPDSVIGFIANPEKADIRFIEYSFRLLKRGLQHEATGTAQDNINLQTIERLEIPLPPLADQRAIAHILGTLDDKIELNRRMNETLEAMARAIFQSWFVDFDPVRAKASGESADAICQRLGLTPELLALFPESFEDSELGEIPTGWRVNVLGDLCSYLSRGVSPKYIEEGGVCVLNQKCIRDGKVSTASARRHDPALRSIAGREIAVGDILVNSTGTGTLGRVAQLMVLDEPTIVDSHVTVVRANSFACAPSYLSLTLMGRQSEIEALGEGSTGQTELSRARLAALKVLVPPIKLMNVFDARVKAFREASSRNDQQNTMLAAARDTLLPKLLSGELSIADAQPHMQGHPS